MTLKQVKEIRQITDRGIYSKAIKIKLHEYAINNGLNPSDVVLVCQKNFSVKDLLAKVDD